MQKQYLSKPKDNISNARYQFDNTIEKKRGNDSVFGWVLNCPATPLMVAKSYINGCLLLMICVFVSCTERSWFSPVSGNVHLCTVSVANGCKKESRKMRCTDNAFTPRVAKKQH
jgi:hypothetical protein